MWRLRRAQGDTVFSDTALYRVKITAPSDQVVVDFGHVPRRLRMEQRKRCNVSAGRCAIS